MKEVVALLKKEAIIEWRTKHTLVSVLLYVGCTIFALYMMVGQPDGKIWNALFWIAQLFIIVNAVSKTFIQEGNARLRYYFTIVAPWQFILGKIIYNLIFVIGVSILTLVLFNILLGDVLFNPIYYYALSILGSGTLAILFTFLSAISAQAGQGAAMTVVLGFPLAIPVILILAKLSVTAISETFVEGYLVMIGVVFLLEILMIALSVILFPFLWGE